MAHEMSAARRNELRCFFAGLYMAGTVVSRAEGLGAEDLAEIAFDHAEAMLKEAAKRESK